MIFRCPEIRKRRGIARSSVIDMGFRPIPGQQVVEAAHAVAVRHALEDVFEVGERVHGDNYAAIGIGGRYER